MSRFLRVFRGLLILVILIMALIMFRGSCRKPAISTSVKFLWFTAPHATANLNHGTEAGEPARRSSLPLLPGVS
ncbi:MAG: hypothetical protein OEM41_02350 [Ignavibacteria bacterium]|nr:hypothetical protein [Ignavibacteria bacterium]